MCTAQRMNPAVFAALPISACTAGTASGFGPDRIAQTTYDLAGRPEAITESVTDPANGQPQSLTDGEGHVSVMVHEGMVPVAGFEPATSSLQNWRSTN